jgi:putative oxidoreductase
MGFLSRYEAAIFTALRVMAGVLFAFHGAQKLFGLFGMGPMTGVPLMLVAGIIELFGGIAIAIGLLTELVSFIASGEMAVAYFMAHFPHGFWPLQNKGESAVLFCFIFLYFAAHGAGPYSVDAMLRRGRAQPALDRTRP